MRIDPALPALLIAVAAKLGGALAVVSGRRLAQLDALLLPYRGAAAGVHGAERRSADGALVALAAEPAIARVKPTLAALVARSPGLLLEDKAWALTLHYRARPELEAECRRAAEEAVRAAAGRLDLIAGRMVFELRTHDARKGNAVAAFLTEPAFAGRRPIFAGDDVIDEDGFAAVDQRGGYGILVGEPRVTAAGYRFAGTAELRRWLAAFAA